MPSSLAPLPRTLAAALAFCTLTLPGCFVLGASTPETPITRTAAAGTATFDCALAALTDLGYVVADAERDVFVRAERRVTDRGFLGTRDRYTHLLTVSEIADELRVTAEREDIAAGENGVHRVPVGPNARTLADADAVLAACAMPDASARL